MQYMYIYIDDRCNIYCATVVDIFQHNESLFVFVKGYKMKSENIRKILVSIKGP